MANIVGSFTVAFDFIDRTTGKPITTEYITPLGVEGDEYMLDPDGNPLFKAPLPGAANGEPVVARKCPQVSNKTPYVGELTQHELDWVSGLPGMNYNVCYRFTVTPAKA